MKILVEVDVTFDAGHGPDLEEIDESARLDPQLGYVPAIPEPFWVRHWLFWSRPSCYSCRLKFATHAAYDMHYLDAHREDANDD